MVDHTTVVCVLHEEFKAIEGPGDLIRVPASDCQAVPNLAADSPHKILLLY